MAITEARRIAFSTSTGSGARIACLGVVFLTEPVLVNSLAAEASELFAIATALPAGAGLLGFESVPAP